MPAARVTFYEDQTEEYEFQIFVGNGTLSNPKYLAYFNQF